MSNPLSRVLRAVGGPVGRRARWTAPSPLSSCTSCYGSWHTLATALGARLPAGLLFLDAPLARCLVLHTGALARALH